jgi:F0F1-type ATP synthase membrane subunit c/vacuolar-type H+-ATPase subunit K
MSLATGLSMLGGSIASGMLAGVAEANAVVAAPEADSSFALLLGLAECVWGADSPG